MLLLSPLFLSITLILFLSTGENPFFIQVRPGKNGKLFKIIKFRTMNSKCDVHGIVLPDHERLTSVGKFLRKFSLDELPQLVNVIKGDLSLIGPRPLLPEYMVLYNDFQKRRHEVKPGITGLAQVNGRNSITWNEKFNLDVQYVEKISFLLDVKILFLTVFKIFRVKEVNAGKNLTMEVFTGNN